jgi:hypothetical protein
MKDLALRAKHWQVFLFLLVPHVASWYTTDYFTDRILGLVSLFCLLTWLVSQVVLVSQLRSDLSGYNVNWFLINAFVLFTAWAYSAISEDPDFYISTNHWKVTGPITFIFFYCVFAYLHIHWFPASLLKATETGLRPDIGQGIVGFFLCFFWPIGIWVMQPRLNKLWEAKQWEQQTIQRLGVREEMSL